MRLVEEEASYMTYGAAYENYCTRYGREPDLPIVTFKQRCSAPNGHMLPDPDGARRYKAGPLFSWAVASL